MPFRSAFGRPPAVAAGGMVATSPPLATRAGLRMLERGGNAADAALDRPRFRVDGGEVRLEEGLWDRAAELAERGYGVLRDADTFGFGGGQAIVVAGEALLGGSDPRKDGYAAGL